MINEKAGHYLNVWDKGLKHTVQYNPKWDTWSP